MRYVHKRHADVQRGYPAGSCSRCGGELFSGQPCWLLWGGVLCRDCAVETVLAELASRRCTVGEVRR